jgi:hypothetical protein
MFACTLLCAEITTSPSNNMARYLLYYCETTPRYSWNIARVGEMHQSVNQSTIVRRILIWLKYYRMKIIRPNKKMCVYSYMWKKSSRSVGIFFFFFFLYIYIYTIGKTRIRFRYFIFEISGKPSFVEAVFMTSCTVFLHSLLSISTKS